MPLCHSSGSDPSSPPGVSPNRTVHIVNTQGTWHLQSDDGEVGGIFVSHEAARRFAEREFRGPQGRPVLDDDAAAPGHVDAPRPLEVPHGRDGIRFFTELAFGRASQ